MNPRMGYDHGKRPSTVMREMLEAAGRANGVPVAKGQKVWRFRNRKTGKKSAFAYVTREAAEREAKIAFGFYQGAGRCAWGDIEFVEEVAE